LRHELARGQRRDPAGRRAGRNDQGCGPTGRVGAGDRSQFGGNTAGGSHERRTSGTGRDSCSTGSNRDTNTSGSGRDCDCDCSDPAAAFAASGPGYHRGNDACAPGFDTSPGRRSRRTGSRYDHGACR
jgi:hypothetical protein